MGASVRMARSSSMDLADGLGRFVESSGSRRMPEAASRLLELLEADEVEPLDQPGAAILAEDLAERLETRLDKLRRRADVLPDGIDLIEDAVAHLRAADGETVHPWTFEDGEGIRWFVLASEDEVIACYTSEPFVEADI